MEQDTTYKMTGVFHEDVYKVLDAVRNTAGMIDMLQRESFIDFGHSKKPSAIAVGCDIYELKNTAEALVHQAERMVRDEERRIFGPLADKEYLG